MNSATSLPKDVGLCAKCQTTNSKSALRCRQCSEVLPWAEKKVTKPAPPQPKGVTPPSGMAPSPFKAKSPTAEFFANLHWGGAITFVLLFGGIFILSFLWPFWGYKMYSYFSREENVLKYAAGAGLVLLFVAIMAIMLIAGNGHKTASP